MKRSATSPDDSRKQNKKSRSKKPEPDYCDVACSVDSGGSAIWPASSDAMETARDFLKRCAKSPGRTLIVPDKDADGLNAGVILHRTLAAMGLSPSLIDVHLIKKGATVHFEEERSAMKAKDPKHVVVVDQGSIAAPPVIDSPDVEALIIDHHLSDQFPKGATVTLTFLDRGILRRRKVLRRSLVVGQFDHGPCMVVSACHYPPVATSSLLTFEICKALHPDVRNSCGYLCVMGTHGDLGNNLKWKSPFPDMTEVFKMHTKKSINDAVALINAPRRTASFDVTTAWEALLAAQTPKELLNNKRLLAARAEINDEVERHAHAPPKFSKDGKIAVLRINSAAQVHPVIATRWAGYLSSKALEIVMCANTGYLSGMVNFSCRIARSARSRDPPVNIIESLKAVADLDDTGLVERMGDSFARGHKEASGGIIPADTFEEFMALMKVGEKPDPVDGTPSPAKKKKAVAEPQKNNLMNYFGKK